MATTYERAHGPDITEPGERLRVAKLHGPKGIGILFAMFAFFFVWAAITFWTARSIAPEPEESGGALREESARPAGAVEGSRTNGER